MNLAEKIAKRIGDSVCDECDNRSHLVNIIAAELEPLRTNMVDGCSGFITPRIACDRAIAIIDGTGEK